MLFDEFVAFSALEVFAHHFAHKFLESGLRHPAELFPGLACIPEKSLHFCRSEIAWVNANNSVRLEASEASLTIPTSLMPSPFQVICMPSSAAAALTKSRTLY